MKTMIRSLGLRGLLLGMLFTPVLAQEEAEDFGWEVKRIGELDYISMEQLASFYGFGDVKRVGSDLLLETDKMKAKFTVATEDFQINRMNLTLEQQIVEADGGAFISRSDLVRFIDPILRPDSIKNATDFKTVILDPAFGGEDPGMVGALGTAAQHTLRIADRCREDLEKMGFKVVMTRHDDRIVSAEERVALANAVEEPAIFISITLRTQAEDPAGLGTSALLTAYDKIAAEGEGVSHASVALGVAVHGSVTVRLGANSKDLGLRGERESALAGVRHPGVVVGVANLAADYDERLVANDKFIGAVAHGVSNGVKRYQMAVTRRKLVR